METLTISQLAMLRLLRKFIRQNTVSPTYSELTRLSRKQLSTVHKTVKVLKEKGMVGQNSSGARALYVTPAGWAMGGQSLSTHDVNRIETLRILEDSAFTGTSYLRDECLFLISIIDRLR